MCILSMCACVFSCVVQGSTRGFRLDLSVSDFDREKFPFTNGERSLVFFILSLQVFHGWKLWGGQPDL